MRRIALTGFVVATGVALSGCPASVDGEIDGEAVSSLISALFTQQERDAGEDTITSVNGVGVSVFDACSGLAKKQANDNDALETLIDDLDGETDPDKIKDAQEAFAQAIVDYEVENFPTDYWFASVGAAAADAGDIDGEIDIDLEDPDPDADVAVGVTVCRVNDHPEVDEVDGVFEVKRDQDCFIAKKGTVDVTGFDEEKSFQLKAEVELIAQDDDGSIDLDDDGDDVVVNISAGFCAPLQDELDNLDDILDDANGA